jgi:hypothetical protein
LASGDGRGVLELSKFGQPENVAAASVIIAIAPMITSTMPIPRSAPS